MRKEKIIDFIKFIFAYGKPLYLKWWLYMLFILIFILSSLLPYLVNLALIKEIISSNQVDTYMQYGVSLLTFWVTSMLTVITVYLSKQANDTNKRILSFNEKSNAPYLEIVIADSHIAVKEQDTLIVHLEIKNPLDKPVVEITCTLHNQQSSNLFDDLYEFIPERLERGLSTNSRGTVEFYEWKILKSDIYCLYPQKTDAIEIDYTVNDSWKSIIQLNIFFRDVFGKQYKQRISLVIDINNTYEILGYSTEVDKIGDSFRLA